MFLAGGESRAAMVIGSTDDIGFNITQDKVHVHDLQATIMHSLGFDHTRLTYRHMGRDFRLTDVAGNVVKKCSPEEGPTFLAWLLLAQRQPAPGTSVIAAAGSSRRSDARVATAVLLAGSSPAGR